MNGQTAGPLLRAVLAAQSEDDAAVRRPSIEQHAAHLLALCSSLGDPLVWPLGRSAERVAGAALMAGQIRTVCWDDSVAGERVLLLLVTAVSAHSLVESARRLRGQGALEVHACGVRVDGARDAVDDDLLCSYSNLSDVRVGQLSLA